MFAYGPQCNLQESLGSANIKGTDQLAHSQSDQTLYNLLKRNFNFYIVSVAEQTGLDLTWPETLKTGFLVARSVCRTNTTCITLHI